MEITAQTKRTNIPPRVVGYHLCPYPSFVSKFDVDSTKICNGFKKVGGGFKKVGGEFKKVWGGFKKVWGQNGCWSPLRVGNAPKSDFPSKIPPKIPPTSPKMDQNWFKIF